jgi:hypothetical protein
MAAYAGTSIIKNGLVLNIDAANTRNFNLSTVEVLVVAGGGGGGWDAGGGGGGGGVVYNSNYAVVPGTSISLTVGAGGTAAVGGIGGQAGDGANTTFGNITAIGGGGAGNKLANGRAGGSGGGAGHGNGTPYIGGTGTTNQGFAGGGNGSSAGLGDNGGGGGGSGGRGNSGQLSTGGSGGPGLPFNISGSLAYYGGGGGGGNYGGTAVGGAGGIGGGGNGGGLSTTGSAGAPNTGGGGGAQGNAGATTGPFAGGSGIVIVRYQGPQKAIGGTVTTNGSYTVHTFTTTGSSTFTPIAQGTLTGVPDFSRQGNFGTPVNGPAYSTDSFVFDGVNDYIDISPIWNSFPTPNTSFTLMAFCKTSSSAGQQEIIEIGEGQAGVITGFRILFYLGKAVGQILNGTTRFNTSGVTTIPNNTYVCVCFTFNGTVSTLYLNGNLEATTSTGNWIKGTTASLGRQADNSAFLAGNVSTAQIYNRALSAIEIQQNFEATRGRYGI